ncbi:hypothetical protein [Cohnella sp. GCM10027633]|uniref:hypothetical protein n=1 Tax=unclassified Cohnella TaxID=2636738 RepID=UPI003641ED3F
MTGFMEGTAEAVIGTVEGLWTMVTHPIETVQRLVYVVKHPLQTVQGIWKAVSDSWTNEVVNGDADSRGRWFGRMIGEVALSVVGTKGVDKVAKLAKGTSIVQEAGGLRIVRVDAPDKVHAQLDPPMRLKQEGDSLPRLSPLEYLPPILKNDAEGAGNALNRIDSGSGHIPMDANKFNAMKNAFEKQGGLIVKEEEALPLLNYHGVEASTLDATTIAFRSNPSTSAVFEEFIHATQYRTGRANGTNIIEMEIEAKEKLINFRKAYGIPNSETRDTIQQLREYRQILEK